MQELTKQQNRIVGLLAEGYNALEIADELKISYATTKNHISSIIRSLQVRGKTEVVVFFYKNKIIKLEEELRKVKE